MSYSVYKHTCPNGKIYVGITSKSPARRWESGCGYKDNEYFYRAIQKYGWANISHEILFGGLTKEEAEQKEIELIAQYKSNQREYGYNHSTGGEKGALGCKHSCEMNDRKRNRMCGENNPMYGKARTEREKEKMSVNRKGKNCGEEHYLHGKRIARDTKQKISEARKGKICGVKNHKSKPVVNIETGALYESARIAAISEGVNYSTMKKMLHVANKKYQYVIA